MCTVRDTHFDNSVLTLISCTTTQFAWTISTISTSSWLRKLNLFTLFFFCPIYSVDPLLSDNIKERGGRGEVMQSISSLVVLVVVGQLFQNFSGEKNTSCPCQLHTLHFWFLNLQFPIFWCKFSGPRGPQVYSWTFLSNTISLSNTFRRKRRNDNIPFRCLDFCPCSLSFVLICKF